MYRYQMSESWHIPRASLGSISGSSASSKRDPRRGLTNRSYQHNESDGGSMSEDSSHNSVNFKTYTKRRHSFQAAPSSKLDDLKQRFDEYSVSSTTARGGGKSRIIHGIHSGSKSLDSCLNNKENKEAQSKRGSRSSQGSSDSNNSSQSASSGSLLLTVANLESFAKIHRKNQSTGTRSSADDFVSLPPCPSQNYNANITLNQNQNSDCVKNCESYHKENTVISISDDADLGNFKAKDVDSISIASSTHFTVVNDNMGGPQRIKKSGICSRGHQITVLIVTMSFVFMIGICAAVFFLEMRAREMPH